MYHCARNITSNERWSTHLGVAVHTLPCEAENLHLPSCEIVGVRHDD